MPLNVWKNMKLLSILNMYVKSLKLMYRRYEKEYKNTWVITF